MIITLFNQCYDCYVCFFISFMFLTNRCIFLTAGGHILYILVLQIHYVHPPTGSCLILFVFSV
jgi:hypothetical protein